MMAPAPPPPPPLPSGLSVPHCTVRVDRRVERLFRAVGQNNVHVLNRDIALAATRGDEAAVAELTRTVYPGELAEAGVSAAGLTLRQFALALIAAGHDRTAVLRALPAEAEGVGAEARALGELKGRVTATQQRGGAQGTAGGPPPPPPPPLPFDGAGASGAAAALESMEVVHPTLGTLEPASRVYHPEKGVVYVVRAASPTRVVCTQFSKHNNEVVLPLDELIAPPIVDPVAAVWWHRDQNSTPIPLKRYPPEVEAALEATWLAGPREAGLSVGGRESGQHPDKVGQPWGCIFEQSGRLGEEYGKYSRNPGRRNRYRIDFHRMKETNLTTGYTQPVVRQPRSEAPPAPLSILELETAVREGGGLVAVKGKGVGRVLFVMDNNAKVELLPDDHPLCQLPRQDDVNSNDSGAPTPTRPTTPPTPPKGTRRSADSSPPNLKTKSTFCPLRNLFALGTDFAAGDAAIPRCFPFATATPAAIPASAFEPQDFRLAALPADAVRDFLAPPTQARWQFRPGTQWASFSIEYSDSLDATFNRTERERVADRGPSAGSSEAASPSLTASSLSLTDGPVAWLTSCHPRGRLASCGVFDGVILQSPWVARPTLTSLRPGDVVAVGEAAGQGTGQPPLQPPPPPPPRPPTPEGKPPPLPTPEHPLLTSPHRSTPTGPHPVSVDLGMLTPAPAASSSPLDSAAVCAMTGRVWIDDSDTEAADVAHSLAAEMERVHGVAFSVEVHSASGHNAPNVGDVVLAIERTVLESVEQELHEGRSLLGAYLLAVPPPSLGLPITLSAPSVDGFRAGALALLASAGRKKVPTHSPAGPSDAAHGRRTSDGADGNTDLAGGYPSHAEATPPVEVIAGPIDDNHVATNDEAEGEAAQAACPAQPADGGADGEMPIVVPVCYFADVPVGSHRKLAAALTPAVQSADAFCTFARLARAFQPSHFRALRRAVKYGRGEDPSTRVVVEGHGLADLVAVGGSVGGGMDLPPPEEAVATDGPDASPRALSATFCSAERALTSVGATEPDGQPPTGNLGCTATVRVQFATEGRHTRHIHDPELHTFPLASLRRPPPPRTTGIDWRRAVFAEQAAAGSCGVHFVQFDDGSAVVVKRSAEPAGELFCARIGGELGITMPGVAVLNVEYGEGAAFCEQLANLALRGRHRCIRSRDTAATKYSSFLVVQQFQPGASLKEICHREDGSSEWAVRCFGPEGALSNDGRRRLRDLGAMIAFDVLTHNSDRWYLERIFSNFSKCGNLGNIMFSPGLDPIAIDNTSNTFRTDTPKGQRAFEAYLTAVRELVVHTRRRVAQSTAATPTGDSAVGDESAAEVATDPLTAGDSTEPQSATGPTEGTAGLPPPHPALEGVRQFFIHGQGSPTDASFMPGLRYDVGAAGTLEVEKGFLRVADQLTQQSEALSRRFAQVEADVRSELCWAVPDGSVKGISRIHAPFLSKVAAAFGP